MTNIYAIIDPDTQEVRYIGKANNIDARLRRHIKNARDGKKYHLCTWINSLLIKGIRPKSIVIEECENDVWKEREAYWIDYYKNAGARLTNHKDGGDGGHYDEISIKRMSDARKGKPPHNKGKKTPDDVRERQSEAAKRKFERMTDEEKKIYGEKISRAMTGLKKGLPGRKKSEAEKKKISLSLIGNKRSLGYKFSDEQRMHLSNGKKGHTTSDETKEKISKILSGRKLSDEQKEKLSIAAKAYWSRKKDEE